MITHTNGLWRNPRRIIKKTRRDETWNHNGYDTVMLFDVKVVVHQRNNY